MIPNLRLPPNLRRRSSKLVGQKFGCFDSKK